MNRLFLKKKTFYRVMSLDKECETKWKAKILKYGEFKKLGCEQYCEKNIKNFKKLRKDEKEMVKCLKDIEM